MGGGGRCHSTHVIRGQLCGVDALLYMGFRDSSKVAKLSWQVPSPSIARRLLTAMFVSSNTIGTLKDKLSFVKSSQQ